ncbi:hypothetical protein SDC9_166463 [bioreactor metagenome]|uniref:Uncharacterized protein n=1 Tax=bioreactor metagenome TaxID=1076179 RepID=A0A645FX55_9ZZZZ
MKITADLLLHRGLALLGRFVKVVGAFLLIQSHNVKNEQKTESKESNTDNDRNHIGFYKAVLVIFINHPFPFHHLKLF